MSLSPALAHDPGTFRASEPAPWPRKNVQHPGTRGPEMLQRPDCSTLRRLLYARIPTQMKSLGLLFCRAWMTMPPCRCQTAPAISVLIQKVNWCTCRMCSIIQRLRRQRCAISEAWWTRILKLLLRLQPQKHHSGWGLKTKVSFQILCKTQCWSLRQGQYQSWSHPTVASGTAPWMPQATSLADGSPLCSTSQKALQAHCPSVLLIQLQIAREIMQQPAAKCLPTRPKISPLVRSPAAPLQLPVRNGCFRQNRQHPPVTKTVTTAAQAAARTWISWQNVDFKRRAGHWREVPHTGNTTRISDMLEQFVAPKLTCAWITALMAPRTVTVITTARQNQRSFAHDTWIGDMCPSGSLLWRNRHHFSTYAQPPDVVSLKGHVNSGTQTLESSYRSPLDRGRNRSRLQQSFSSWSCSSSSLGTPPSRIPFSTRSRSFSPKSGSGSSLSRSRSDAEAYGLDPMFCRSRSSSPGSRTQPPVHRSTGTPASSKRTFIPRFKTGNPDGTVRKNNGSMSTECEHDDQAQPKVYAASVMTTGSKKTRTAHTTGASKEPARMPWRTSTKPATNTMKCPTLTKNTPRTAAPARPPSSKAVSAAGTPFKVPWTRSAKLGVKSPLDHFAPKPPPPCQVQGKDTQSTPGSSCPCTSLGNSQQRTRQGCGQCRAKRLHRSRLPLTKGCRTPDGAVCSGKNIPVGHVRGDPEGLCDGPGYTEGDNVTVGYFMKETCQFRLGRGGEIVMLWKARKGVVGPSTRAGAFAATFCQQHLVQHGAHHSQLLPDAACQGILYTSGLLVWPQSHPPICAPPPWLYSVVTIHTYMLSH